MRITFKETEDGQANKIFLNGKFIGMVEMQSFGKFWKMKPVFHYNYRRDAEEVRKKYDSYYDAGKALVRLYEITFDRIDDEDITDEFDMRGVFKPFSYGP
jgi:hypothetical protein